MTTRKFLSESLSFLIFFVFLKTQVAFAADQNPMGTWLDQSGRGAIEIKPCGDKMCGHLVWIRGNEGAEGCGLQIIGGARKVKEGVWDGGWIYSPEKNRKYDVEIKPLSDGTLRVKGYAGSKMFSKTMIWKPAPSDLKLCNDNSKKNNAASKEADKDASTPSSQPLQNTSKNNMVTSSKDPDFLQSNEEALNSEIEGKGEERSNTNTGNQQGEIVPAPSSKKDGPQKEVQRSGDKDPSLAGTSFPTRPLKQNLAQLQRGTGYGVTKIGNGMCRLRVPFVTIHIPCD